MQEGVDGSSFQAGFHPVIIRLDVRLGKVASASDRKQAVEKNGCSVGATTMV